MSAADHWLIEQGISEDRAIQVQHGQIVAARIVRHDAALRAGAVLPMRLLRQWVPGRSGIVIGAQGEEALLQPLPGGLSEGATTMVEIVREAMTEPGGRSKRALARPTEGQAERAAPALFDELRAGHDDVRRCHASGPDQFAEHGWGELCEAADSGVVAFAGGTLLIHLTPAMTLIDVDGTLPARSLALAAAPVAARAIAQLGIAGNIGIDFPTLSSKADRTAVADAFAAALTVSAERTAINGFGFMQIVTRRRHSSLIEVRQREPVLTAALDLLRSAERARGSGPIMLDCTPAVAALLARRPDWLAEAERRCGRPVRCPGLQ